MLLSVRIVNTKRKIEKSQQAKSTHNRELIIDQPNVAKKVVFICLSDTYFRFIYSFGSTRKINTV